MERDFFTVHETDVLELVSDMMVWKDIRHTVVEDENGQFVGLLTSGILLKHFTRRSTIHDVKAKLVKDIMLSGDDIDTIEPSATLIDVIKKMNRKKVGCLPVVKDGHLIGIISENDFLKLSERLLSRMHQMEVEQKDRVEVE